MPVNRCHFCEGPLQLTGDVCSDQTDLAIGKCSHCELVQVTDFVHVNSEYYVSGSSLPEDFEAERKRTWHWNRKRILRLKETLQDVSTKRLLDFGCGTGGLLEQGQSVFREVVGFDLSAQVCRMHRERGWNCVSSLDQAPSDIDIVALFHVLEHVPAPWSLLTSLKEHFTQAGTFVIEVPNTSEGLNTLFKNEAYRRNHFGRDHLYYFTNETLRRIVERAGLDVVVDSQLQRYTLSNTMGWLANGKGGGQNMWEFFNDEQLNDHYERVLISKRIADSVFLICSRKTEDGVFRG